MRRRGAALTAERPGGGSCSSPTSTRPCRDTGVLRPAAMAKWLRRLGHEVTVLTTSAYGDGPTDAARTWSAPPTPSAGAPGSPARTRSTRCSTRPPTAGRPHPLSKVLVPEPLVAAWVPFARSRGAAPAARAPLRLRDHHLAARVGARGRPRAAAPRRALGRRRPRRLDLRVAAAASSRPRSSAASTSGSSAAGSAPPTRSSASPSPAADDLRAARDRRAAADPQRLGPGGGAGARAEPTGLLDPERVSLVYTGRFGSYGRDPRPLVEALGELARSDPEAAAKLELVIAGPLTDDEARAARHRRLPGADRPRRQPRPRGRRSRCSARPTRCC